MKTQTIEVTGSNAGIRPAGRHQTHKRHYGSADDLPGNAALYFRRTIAVSGYYIFDFLFEKTQTTGNHSPSAAAFTRLTKLLCLN